MPSKNPVKVLHVISDLRRGGRERQLAILASNSNRYFENNILAFYEKPNGFQEEYKLNIIYSKSGRLKRFLDIRKQIKENKIDIIHAWGNSETLYSLLAAKLTDIPLINGSIRHGIRKNNFSQRFRSFVLKLSKYIIANSQAGLSANGIKKNEQRHFVIYNGIEEKFFTCFNKEKRENFNSEHNLSSDSIVFISIANLVPYKDYKTVINSLSVLKNELSFHYNIIGKGPLLNEIKNLIKKYQLEDKITIHSEKPDISGLLSISDIMIHSSLGEGCSNAILEASASGLIVVASNTGGTKEIVNKWNLLFEYKNGNDLMQKIKTAVKMKNSDSAIREKIQSETKKRFSVESFIRNYNEVVSKIINN